MASGERGKFIREAVRAHPEIYFARFVVLGEGASEEVILPRVAKALGVEIDPNFVAMVPLGGRHVNHFWKLLSALEIPFITVLDLDLEREGGGWGRIKYALEQLLETGVPEADVLAGITRAQLTEMHTWPANDANLGSWITHLAGRGVIFSARPEPPDAGECRAFQFANEQAEAEHLAGLIQSWIRDEGLAPRDICILCRMKTAAYTAALIERLAATDIAARIEDNFQRVLSEDICAALVDVFTLATQRSAPLAWERTLGFLSFYSGGYDPTDAHNLASRLLDFTDDLAGRLTDAVTGEEEIQALLLDALSFFGRSKVCAALPQYGQGSFLDDLLGDLTDFLVEARSRFAWPEAVAAVIGAGSVPIMTTHKSKGLEFHTMVFIGLEDDALFNFAKDPEEETCGIFVALSRAKQRAFFTFSSQRTVGRYATKSRHAIDGLYDLFAQAGIVVEVVP